MSNNTNTRKRCSATSKARIVLKVLKKTKSIPQIAFDHQVRPKLVMELKAFMPASEIKMTSSSRKGLRG